MSFSVGVHPPKTPVTAGSSGKAKVTTPNVCKMPGPPAPFVPSPLPNIGKSGNSPKGYSKTVEIEGCKVAIRGATFESMGDMASKGTGGGLISANTHGPTKFITPGSLTVKIEGKNVHLLGEPMLNNCGSSGGPPNTGATLSGLDQSDIEKWDRKLQDYIDECDKLTEPYDPKTEEDCNTPVFPTEWTKDAKGKPKKRTVGMKMGKAKENCVYYDKMNAQDGIPKTDSKGNSATVQQRFNPDLTPTKPGETWVGTFVPDVIYRSADGTIEAVRDLKFPCPPGDKKEGQWTPGQERKYARLLGPGKGPPTLKFPTIL